LRGGAAKVLWTMRGNQVYPFCYTEVTESFCVEFGAVATSRLDARFGLMGKEPN
jgi:hypothetical protein